MQNIKFKIVVLLIWIIPGKFSYAQESQLSTGSKETISCNDPIVEMLDSLVTLNNVIRYNNYIGSGISSQTDVSYGVPFFSDDVYRDRISKINTPIPLVYNSQVRNYIDLYASRKRELTSRVLGLSNLYFPLFEEILDKEGLPLEFKYLSVVESALNPTAVSRVGATGIWQFMLNTGKLYDLKVNSYTDERRDPVKATHAACKYFRDMYDIYRDWLLVIAAYNCGAGNVNRAIIRSGGKTNFWEISRYLPAETRGYVPAFIAVCYVMNYAPEHNLIPVTPAFSYFEVDTLKIRKKTSLAKIATNIDLPLDVVYYLNPTFKKGIIPETDDAQIIRLPANKLSVFLANENSIYSNEPLQPAPVLADLKFTKHEEEENDNGQYTYTYKKINKTHVVRRGETISELADIYNCTASDIKKLNKLKSNKLHRGQKLKLFAWVRIKHPVQVPDSKTAADNTQKDSAVSVLAKNDSSLNNSTPDITAKEEDSISTSQNAVTEKQESGMSSPKYIYHLVQRGDTLWNIARRYEGATVEQIMELNQISARKTLKTGTKIKVKVAG